MHGSDSIGASPRPRGRPAQNAAHPVDEDRLLAVAFADFAERGYDGTALRDIAKRTGVSHNLINVRYGRKEDLWRRAVAWRFDRASPLVTVAFDEDADPETRLRDLVIRFCLWAIDNSDIVGLSHIEGAHSSWRLDFIVEEFIRPFKDRLDGLVSAVAAERPVAPVSTAALMALMVQGVGFFFRSGPLQERLGAGAEIDPSRRAHEVARGMAVLLLGGLLPRDEPEGGYPSPDRGNGP